MTSLNLIVFLKQVADNTKLKFNEAGPVFDGVPMMMNPYDEYALETALRLKEATGEGTTLTVLSLGAPSVKEMLKKAIALGADQAFLISDEDAKNGDSTANAHLLAQALKILLPDYHILLFGQSSLDEAAGQTGLKIAELLNLPSLTYCKQAELGDNLLRVTRETERGYEIHEMTLPGVLNVIKCDYELRGSNIKGVMKANKTEIPIKTIADLGLSPEQFGEAGWHTHVVKSWQRPVKSGATMIQGTDDAQTAVTQLVFALKSAKIL